MNKHYNEAAETRRALEKALTDTLNINHVQASALVERMIDYFKVMRQELRKYDGK